MVVDDKVNNGLRKCIVQLVNTLIALTFIWHETEQNAIIFYPVVLIPVHKKTFRTISVVLYILHSNAHFRVKMFKRNIYFSHTVSLLKYKFFS